MVSKICFKCNEDKPLSDYYKHKQMGDGHLNKCKDCARKDVQERVNLLSGNPNWVIGEKRRHRDKYYRLGYKNKHKPTTEAKRMVITRYKNKYPEKLKAKNSAQRLPRPDGVELHHWNYNPEYYKDTIALTSKQHAKTHRFIIYDQSCFMYRRIDNNQLLDTKQKHEEYIRWCIEFKED